MRLCLEAQDLESGDDIAYRGIVSAVTVDGDTVTVTMRSSADRLELWAHDFVWVDRAVRW